MWCLLGRRERRTPETHTDVQEQCERSRLRSFRLRWALAAIATTALAFGIAVATLRWYMSPQVNRTIFNESSTSIYDLRFISAMIVLDRACARP
jgi:hypothetical protein